MFQIALIKTMKASYISVIALLVFLVLQVSAYSPFSYALSNSELSDEEYFIDFAERKNVIVGLLSTQKETFAGEYNNPKLIMEMLSNFGVKVILIDYNTVVDFNLIKNSNLGNFPNIQEKQFIDNQVKKFIVDNNINRIFIPGNYYNVSSQPLPPTPYRQIITNALVEIVDQNPHIHLLTICGGLQGMMVAKGIEITRVEDIIGELKVGEYNHISSFPHPKEVNANLHKITVSSSSRLAKIIHKQLKKDQDSLVLYFPDYHYEAINNTYDNMRKLKVSGYKIIARSEDGIIEAIEDKHANIHFQIHPEYLVINASDKYTNDSRKNFSIDVAIAIIKDFLYRK